ncbi:NAD(P)/FAD-dependent oxidoreductase [Tenacibaculum sp. MEBiC06402]|uniref:NAD(P)/FAD-dependent oxidoreductase n=1 Tax=unclassified Tenacibaculum TaxID=2635139 RepID=UPI003B9CAD5F
MKQVYDVIIIGAGPGGGQCARVLSKKGYKVLLVEKFASFRENNYSSAGMSLSPLKEFGIPESVVGSFWNKIDIQCTKNKYAWESKNMQGAVLDFGSLKQFLADETLSNGGDVLLGYKYFKKEHQEDKIIAHFKNTKTKEILTLESKLLVDATGANRKVIYDKKSEEPEFFIGTGIEYLIKVEDDVYKNCDNKLTFFLGHKWAKYGYSWIFPMGDNILKVGAGKVFVEDENEANDSVKKYTLKVLEDFLGLKNYELLDIHGGVVRYSAGIHDTFYKNRVVAIGDAISAINPKGGEGIKYAMRSADTASKYIDSYLKTGKESFNNYRRIWRMKYWFSWKLSEIAARKIYYKYSDEKIEYRMSTYNKTSNMQVLVDSLFEFKPHKIFYKILALYFLDLKSKVTGVFK